MSESLSRTSLEREPAEPSARPDLALPDWDEIEQMLDELPPGIPILPPEDATNFSKYRYPPPMMPAPQAWKICTDAMEKYDSDLCKAYREEIDTLLVFAGLFSAVVTGFTIESYQWLQDDPSDTTNALLAQIARSLAPNGTAPVLPSASSMGRSVSARINAYWFVSLALSLSAALVAILGKQWVREYERRASDRTPKELIGVRQLKFEGLQYWKVGDIISALPMLLQLSLALFALGILELLWNLHTAVAVTVCIPTAAAVVFYSATTFFPVIQYSRRHNDDPPPPQCAYKSPQALAAMHMYQTVARALRSLIAHLPYRLKMAYDVPNHHWLRDYIPDRDVWFWNFRWTKAWDHWDTGFYLTDRYFARPRGGSPFRGLHWLFRNVDERNIQEAFWNCLWDEAHSPDTHPADRYFSYECNRDTRLRRGIMHNRYKYNRDTRLRRGIMHNREIDPVWTKATLWQCAVTFIPRRHGADECISEILIHCLPSMDMSIAYEMLGELLVVSFDDCELIRSLVKAVLSYCRQHINEDISGLIARTSLIVSHCLDNGTQSALQWVLVSFAANWLRAQAFSGDQFDAKGMMVIIRTNMFEMLSHSPEDFVHHPQRLHHLPHILALAALLRAEYERDYRPITWSMPVLDDIWRYTNDHGWASHPEWEPMIMEIFKISVCGVDRDSPIGTPEHTNGRRNGIADGARTPPDAVPPAGAAGTAAAETALPSEAAQTALPHSHEDAQSAASFPGLRESAHGHDARDSPLDAEIAPAVDRVEIIIVPAERDDARTSTDAALLDSHLVDDVGVQDAGGGSALASDRAGEDSIDVVHAGAAAVRAVGDQHDVPAAQAPAASGRTPPPTDGMIADPATPRSRDPLALELPDEADALTRQTTHTDDLAEHVGVHNASEQLTAASGVLAGMPPLQSTTGAAAEPSAMSDKEDVSQTLTDGISAFAGGNSVRAADEDVAIFAPHAHAEQPELSILLESRRVHRASGTDIRARDVASTEERHERSGSTGAEGPTEAQLGKRAGKADPSPQRTVHAPGRGLEASAILPEPSADAGIATAPAVSHLDDPSAAEGVREQRDEIGGGGAPLDA